MFGSLLCTPPLPPLNWGGLMMFYPTPSTLSYLWNFGSMLGINLMVQIMTGLLLASMFEWSNFYSVLRSIEWAWLIQSLHANGANLFFILLFIHLGRGLYYHSNLNSWVWVSGVLILVLVMATAFLGYVLPWGQMSFWGATVITNLVSAIPYVGPTITIWLWGGFTVTSTTLVRFYSLHFILPFVILSVVSLHLILLHFKGSTNPTGLNSHLDMAPFHPLFTMKDSVSFMMMISGLLVLSILSPYGLMDPDNFMPSNPSVTPAHIQPEWYFLFAYAILRSIPNKLFGVIMLVCSLSVLITIPFTYTLNQFNPINKGIFWFMVSNFIFLTWIGAQPVEYPYQVLGQSASINYFLLFISSQLNYNKFTTQIKMKFLM